MAIPRGAARRVLVIAALAGVAYLAVLLTVVAAPFGRLTLNDQLFTAVLVVLGAPLAAGLGLLVWHAAKLCAGDLAFRDDMTGLPNRRAFMNDVTGRMKGACAGSVALVLLDVDGLKSLNDRCGHQAGDELIRIAAHRLERVAQKQGKVYRVGGDEFAILVSRSEGGRLSPVVRALATLEMRFRTCNHVHAVSLSFGYASCVEGESFESLFRRTDARLYEGKNADARRLALVSGETPRWRTSVKTFGFEDETPNPELALVQV
jgi:diguanylate cyclase (GGDEF)-like protein